MYAPAEQAPVHAVHHLLNPPVYPISARKFPSGFNRDPAPIVRWVGQASDGFCEREVGRHRALVQGSLGQETLHSFQVGIERLSIAPLRSLTRHP
jgi:hypothetical protein